MDEERKLIIDLAERAIMYRMFDSIRKQPGQMIENLPEDQREVLRGLKSDHMNGILPFWLRK